MQKDTNKKFVEEKNKPEVGRPSMLNFDITGDAGDATQEVSDLEGPGKLPDKVFLSSPGHRKTETGDRLDSQQTIGFGRPTRTEKSDERAYKITTPRVFQAAF